MISYCAKLESVHCLHALSSDRVGKELPMIIVHVSVLIRNHCGIVLTACSNNLISLNSTRGTYTLICTTIVLLEYIVCTTNNIMQHQQTTKKSVSPYKLT